MYTSRGRLRTTSDCVPVVFAYGAGVGFELVGVGVSESGSWESGSGIGVTVVSVEDTVASSKGVAAEAEV